MRILICGAGVAGPALAFWLHRHGHQVTVVERAPALRDGGAAVDFRGPALDVLDWMDLLATMHRHQTRMGAMTLVDGTGATVATLPPAVLSGDLEVLKADVTRVLHEATRDTTEYQFGDTIVAIDQDADGVRVEFERRAAETFDLVVGADGLHSVVRRLAFGPESRYLRHLGVHGALFATDNFLDLDHAGLMFNTAGRSALTFSARDNAELRVGLSFVAENLRYDRGDRAEQEDLVARHFAGAGWEVPRLLVAMRTASDFFFDSSSQVVMDRWSTGRVVLLGDAAHCAAPTSGMGTSQALVGAYVLAGELAQGPDHVAAFARYQARLSDYVVRNQRLGRAAARWFFQEPIGEATDADAEDVGDPLALVRYTNPGRPC